MKIAIAAGGTGGHILPAIAIAKQLINNDLEVLFIGNKHSMEEKIASEHEIAFAAIDVQKLYRYFTFSHFKFIPKLIRSIIRARRLLKQHNCDAFIGVGGFVSAPVGWAASLLKLPIYLHEQNSYPGLTTRILSKKARLIFLGNEQAKQYLQQCKTILSGNPVNPSLAEKTHKLEYEKFGLSRDKFHLLVQGGSQGSTALNNAILPIVDDLLAEGIELIWQVGNRQYDEITSKLGEKKEIYCFTFSNEMGMLYSSVDMAVSRGGALTLAELETKKIPALIVPLPHAAGNHQYHNAKEAQKKGWAQILLQKDLLPQNLKAKILNMKAKLQEYKFDISIHETAAQNIVDRIMEDIEKLC
jgi:UDP-N-acetylglucosamine--N-acetylmuramyl-(pentapeptide) pyrophosphoryl-undecaprenol N-acetylglucosamine transferase